MLKRVYIEITNRCNLRCSFCSFHHRKIEEMNLDAFEKCLKEIKPITDYIYLHVQGEPLLHSKFQQILTLCDVYGMKVQLVSNGILLNDSISFDHPSIRKVSFSLHSIEENKVDVSSYMDRILSFIQRYQSKFYIECRFWLKESMKERSNYCFNRIQDIYPLKELSRESYQLADKVYLNFDHEFKWPQNTNNKYENGTCLGAKSMLAILSDGTVTICCLDCEGDVCLGNIFEQSLGSILNGEQYKKIIKGFQDNKCIASLCKKCEYRNRFR